MKLGLAAAAAMLTGITGASGDEMHAGIGQPEIAHFKKENDLHKFTREEIQKLEGDIESGKLPLYLQVKFMGEALRADGPFTLELSNLNLSRERLSQIHGLADRVSARLTTAYTDWKKHPPELDEHFKEADKLREATSLYKVNDLKGALCNRFSVRDGDEVYNVTAFHCIKGSVLQDEYYHPPYTDIAVKYLPRESWKLYDVKDPANLPAVDHRANRYAIAGRVMTAFSRGARNEPKVHFSFAMPLPLNKDLIFNKNDAQKLAVLGAEDWMMYFKPYSEGQFNPETGKVNASGSSGGPVAVEGFGVVGTTSATYEISDRCSKTCHATAFFTPPDIFHKAITGEREIRKKRF